jgi:hypothetical protein
MVVGGIRGHRENLFSSIAQLVSVPIQILQEYKILYSFVWDRGYRFAGLNTKTEIKTHGQSLSKNVTFEVLASVVDLWDPYLSNVNSNCFDGSGLFRRFGRCLWVAFKLNNESKTIPQRWPILEASK